MQNKTQFKSKSRRRSFDVATVFSIFLKVILIIVLIARIALAVLNYFSPFSSVLVLILEIATLALWAVTLFITLF